MSKQGEEKWTAEDEARRWRAAFRSETHLSWSVWVSAVERGDGEAVRVCESLDGVSEKTKPKEDKTKEKNNKNEQTKKPRRHRKVQRLREAELDGLGEGVGSGCGRGD